jgi:undecaprenyl-diphosphatase
MILIMGMRPEEVLSITVYLHLGTSLAALLYFRGEISDIFKREKPEDKKLFTYLFVTTIFTGVIGFPLFLYAQTTAQLGERIIAFTGGALIITGIIQKSSERFNLVRASDNPSIFEGVIMGIVQGLSAIPGISRSGVTTSALLFKGHRGEEALKLSFLMSVPATLAAVVGLSLIEGVNSFNVSLLMAILASFITGYLTIGILLRIAKLVEFWKFCIILGVTAILGFLPSLI